MKRSHFKILVVALLSAMLVLAACGGGATPTADVSGLEEAAEEELFVGYSGPTQLDNFQIVLWEGMEERANELGVKITMLESDWDPVAQADDIEDFLAQGVDALIVNAADADGVIPSIENANEQGVPVFTIDSAANGGEVLSHSGNDLYCIGYRSMEHLAEEIGGSGKVLHINGAPGLMIVTWNDAGVNDFLADHPDIELVQQAYGEWDQAQAQAITEDILTVHPDLDGVYVISESMTGGAIQALAAANLSDDVMVMNGGFGPESQQWLEEGQTIATMEWASKEGAAELMQYVYDYLTEGTEPPEWTPWPVSLHKADGETVSVDCPIEDWTP